MANAAVEFFSDASTGSNTTNLGAVCSRILPTDSNLPHAYQDYPPKRPAHPQLRVQNGSRCVSGAASIMQPTDEISGPLRSS